MHDFTMIGYKQILLKDNYLSPAQLSLAVKHYAKSQKQGYLGIFPEFLIKVKMITIEQHREIQEKCATRTTAHPESKDALPNRFGHYEVVSKIASGGMGVVYKARHSSGELVALKVLLSMASAQEIDLKRFRREAESAAKVRHPNIVNIREFGEQNGIYYLVMDYVQGEPLSGKQLRKVNQCVEICAQICQGLSCIHEEGIVHRDIKPANILLDTSGELTPKITDFSLALMGDPLKSRITQTGTALGTPYYMSPEQAMAKRNIDFRTDIYSLGVVLYELVSGKVPFQANSMTDLYAKIMNERPIPLSTVRRTVKKDLDLIVERSMAKDPDHRYQNCEQMEQDLHAYLDKKKPKNCLDITLWKRVERKFPINKSNAIIITLSVFLVVTLAIIAVLLGKKATLDPVVVRHLKQAKNALDHKNFCTALKYLKMAHKIAPRDNAVQTLQKEFRASVLRAKNSIMKRVERSYAGGNTRKTTAWLEVLGEVGWQCDKAYLLYRKLSATNTRDPAIWPMLQELESLPLAFIIAGVENSAKSSPLFTAICALRMSDFTKASNILESAKQDDSLSLYFRGKSRAYIGDWLRGREDLKQATACFGKPPREMLACFYHLGQNDYAAIYQHLQRLKKSMPTRDTLLCQVLEEMALAEIIGGKQYYRTSAQKLAAICHTLTDKYHVPGAYLYLAIIRTEQWQDGPAQEQFARAIDAGVPKLFVLYHQCKLDLDPAFLGPLQREVDSTPGFAPAYIALGDLATFANRRREALGYYRDAEKLLPDSVEAQCGIGICLLSLKETQSGFAALDRAIELYHGKYRSPHGLARMQALAAAMAYFKKGIQLDKNGDTNRALTCYRNAAHIYQYWRLPLETLFKYYCSRQWYYRGLLDVFENFPHEISRQKAMGKISSKRLKRDALRQIQKQIKTAPTGSEKYALLLAKQGFVLFLMGKIENSKLALDEAANMAEKAEIYFLRGECNFHLKKYRESIADYSRALKLDPGYYRARFGRIRIYSVKSQEKTFKRFRFLRGEIEITLQAHPDYRYDDMFFHFTNDLLSRYLSLEDPKELAKVRTFWQYLMRQNKSNAFHNRTWGCYAYANSLHRAKEDDQAEQLYNQAIRWSPAYYDAYWTRGRFFEDTGKSEKAASDYRMALFLLKGTTSEHYRKIAQRLKKLDDRGVK